MKSTFLTWFACATLVAAQTPPFPSGPFYIVSTVDSLSRWGIFDDSKEPEARIVVSDETTSSQLWSYNTTTGYLTNVNTDNPALVVTVSSDAFDTFLVQNFTKSEPDDLGQIWTYSSDDETLVTLADETMCATFDAGNISMQQCDGSQEQKWLLEQLS